MPAASLGHVVSRNSTSGKNRPALIERVEPRRFMSTTMLSHDYISELSETYYGEVQVGDNGNQWGTPTSYSGVGDDMDAWSYQTWDNNLDDGLDSGQQNFAFNLNADGAGNEVWDVGRSNESFYVGTSPSINKVTLQAAVAGSDMEIDFTNVSVCFYHNGTLVETDTVGNFNANTMGESSNDPQETIVAITPSAQNINGVAVTAKVQLKTAEGTYANPTDIFGQVLIT